eukprot:TRINITY_DN25747_c0_g1_i3.p1 TRINITY_DN25747_c0_g1~~TRINITY_DN25747_c0_g1_i3.p1  ORF type:complete len:158 (-),score=35.84 TRINITY_DN25747_c0_g1_i3:79-552(-)
MTEREIPVIQKDSLEARFLFFCGDVSLELIREVSHMNRESYESGEERENQQQGMEEEKAIDPNAHDDSDEIADEKSLEVYHDPSDESQNGSRGRGRRDSGHSQSQSQRSRVSRSSRRVHFANGHLPPLHESDDDDDLDQLPPPIPQPGLTKNKSHYL